MSETKKVVINKCYGGFGLSEAAYEKLIEWGVPAKPYIKQERGEDGRYNNPPENEGEIIFDRTLYADELNFGSLTGRYWDTWINYNREHPLLIRVVEELGDKASGRFAELGVVEIPAGVEYEIDEYDGIEHIAEVHRTWS